MTMRLELIHEYTINTVIDAVKRWLDIHPEVTIRHITQSESGRKKDGSWAMTICIYYDDNCPPPKYMSEDLRDGRAKQ